jgi:hypothetical protein
MSDLLVNITDISEQVVYEALDELVERHGASYYTLVVDRVVQPVDQNSPHLVIERFDAELYATARELFETMLDRCVHPPQRLVEAYERMIEFTGDENGRKLLEHYRAQGG